jgi:serine/threonine-protein kinase
VLEGKHGGAIRDAYNSRAQIRSVLARLPETEKALLPEILPTVESLVERVRTLAIALQALDSEASPDAIVRLQTRLSETEAMDPAAPERLRRIELLERQLATLTDLGERRVTLAQQMDHALLVLETMKLDLMRLRSSGVESALAEGGQLTQEMRALAKDVQRVSEAVDETRKGF